MRLADQLAGTAPLPPSDAFGHALLGRARTLSARIAALWELPPAVGQAILHAGQPDATALAQVLHAADRLARLRVLADAGVEAAATLAAALPAGQARLFDRLRAPEA